MYAYTCIHIRTRIRKLCIHTTNQDFGTITILRDIDGFMAKFLLFCMGFIGIIVVIETICEVLFYDTVKKFVERKLDITLCAIPCLK